MDKHSSCEVPSATTGWDKYLTKSAAISLYTGLYTPSRAAVRTALCGIRVCSNEQHPCAPTTRSFPLSCLSASADTYTITASPLPLLPPPAVRCTSTTVVSDLHHVRPAPAPKRRRAPASPRYASVGRHEPRVLGLPVFIRS
ncbi:hypothetical protein EAG_13113 [Camponotus floridanus]|uniref:Uncharacterized protein n=1 Tax=Camponotus floridanus TaxID=104421 RepID=E2APQ3_CAMFO|nr:hypothetical protein EAG_13113 [Camponotus floridanus]